MGESVHCDPQSHRETWTPPFEWMGWGNIAGTLITMRGIPSDLEIRALLRGWRDGELLTEAQLRSCEEDGFRIFWGEGDENYIDVARQQVHGSWTFRFVASFEASRTFGQIHVILPRPCDLRAYEAAIEYLVERPTA